MSAWRDGRDEIMDADYKVTIKVDGSIMPDPGTWSGRLWQRVKAWWARVNAPVEKVECAECGLLREALATANARVEEVEKRLQEPLPDRVRREAAEKSNPLPDMVGAFPDFPLPDAHSLPYPERREVYAETPARVPVTPEPLVARRDRGTELPKPTRLAGHTAAKAKRSR